MSKRKYLGAFTPSQRQHGYKSYPPFINFSQTDDDKITVLIRGEEKTVIAKDSEYLPDGTTYQQSGDMIEVKFDKQSILWLLEDVVNKLRDDS